MDAEQIEQLPESRLSGPDRVAALLLAMGPPVARRLLPYFDPEELKEISQAATGLGAVPAQEIEPVIEEFANQFSAGLSLLGSSRAVEELLSGILEPEEIERLMSEPLTPQQEQTVWERLAGLPDGVLSKYLSQEHPQTIAYVLNNVDPNSASDSLRQLPKAKREDLVRRMLCARRPTEFVQRVVLETLKSDLLGGGGPVSENTRHEHLAQIMNGMDGDEVETMLESLENIRPKAVKALKDLLFSFNDLLQLSEGGRAKVLERTSTERLVMALYGMDEDFQEKILSVLPQRERRIAQNELSSGKPGSERRVREARRAIAAIALELAEQGEINLDGSQGGGEVG